MAIDLSRVASKAIEAALEDGHQRRHGSATRALAAGAVLAVGARAAMSRTPGPAKFALKHLPGLSELRDMPERIRDRMTDAGWLDDDTDVEEPEDAYEADEDLDEEPGAEEDIDDEEDLDEEEEPEGEGDEDFEDDEEEDPEAEGDDDEEDLDDDDPEAEGDEDFDDDEDFDEDDEDPDAEADEDFDDEDDEEPPPELEIESEDDDDLHPEDRPPKPPRSKSTSGR